MTASQKNDSDYKGFSSHFLNALIVAVTEASGSQWQIAATPGDTSSPDDSTPIWIRLALDGSLRGEFFLELLRPDAASLIAKILHQPASDFDATQSQALLELVKTAMREFRSAIGQEFGTFSIDAALATAPPDSLANAVEAFAACEDGTCLSIRIHLNRELTDSLFLHSRVEKTAQNVWGAANAPAGKTIPEAVNLDLVMDVELNVTLRFGQRQLTLREVLELTSGSVVELDRQVDEPVELFLDGMVIARGEAVVIDGNYGLRVTEVARPVSSAVLSLAQ
jgi:flagellar motor switch protein FliN/FliY